MISVTEAETRILTAVRKTPLEQLVIPIVLAVSLVET